jgi:hypothetical protein
MERKTGLILGGGIVLAAVAYFLLNPDALTGQGAAGGGGSRSGGGILGTGENPLTTLLNLPSDNFSGFPSPQLLTLEQLMTPPPPISGGETTTSKKTTVKLSEQSFAVGSSGSILNALIPTPATLTGSYGTTDYYVGKTLYGAPVDIALDKKSNTVTVTDPVRALTPMKFNLGPDLASVFGLGDNPVQLLAKKDTMAAVQDTGGSGVSTVGKTTPSLIFTNTGKGTDAPGTATFAVGGISTSRDLSASEQASTAATYAAKGWSVPTFQGTVTATKGAGTTTTVSSKKSSVPSNYSSPPPSSKSSSKSSGGSKK